ncbi:uncharacterized protein BCR38DRAFT_521093 [Pseudomassariella vexata]|uniref:Uncharacterized protein n=1 Tax=Pseudomassariella vexata TaxID=1141098 RepID=A0A1Y2EFC9_9PEZI|nr:uncharacterized protein BCR38DRAFT_521093 [Pseudomassariella vexata]ORY70282.1 hypothetical protein BCR38DRAFT_521093 [Pseudomassariella vexata]
MDPPEDNAAKSTKGQKRRSLTVALQDGIRALVIDQIAISNLVTQPSSAANDSPSIVTRKVHDRNSMNHPQNLAKAAIKQHLKTLRDSRSLPVVWDFSEFTPDNADEWFPQVLYGIHLPDHPQRTPSEPRRVEVFIDLCFKKGRLPCIPLIKPDNISEWLHLLILPVDNLKTELPLSGQQREDALKHWEGFGVTNNNVYQPPPEFIQQPTKTAPVKVLKGSSKSLTISADGKPLITQAVPDAQEYLTKEQLSRVSRLSCPESKRPTSSLSIRTDSSAVTVIKTESQGPDNTASKQDQKKDLRDSKGRKLSTNTLPLDKPTFSAKSDNRKPTITKSSLKDKVAKMVTTRAKSNTEEGVDTTGGRGPRPNYTAHEQYDFLGGDEIIVQDESRDDDEFQVGSNLQKGSSSKDNQSTALSSAENELLTFDDIIKGDVPLSLSTQPMAKNVSKKGPFQSLKAARAEAKKNSGAMGPEADASPFSADQEMTESLAEAANTAIYAAGQNKAKRRSGIRKDERKSKNDTGAYAAESSTAGQPGAMKSKAPTAELSAPAQVQAIIPSGEEDTQGKANVSSGFNIPQTYSPAKANFIGRGADTTNGNGQLPTPSGAYIPHLATPMPSGARDIYAIMHHHRLGPYSVDPFNGRLLNPAEVEEIEPEPLYGHHPPYPFDGARHIINNEGLGPTNGLQLPLPMSSPRGSFAQYSPASQQGLSRPSSQGSTSVRPQKLRTSGRPHFAPTAHPEDLYNSRGDLVHETLMQDVEFAAHSNAIPGHNNQPSYIPTGIVGYIDPRDITDFSQLNPLDPRLHGFNNSSAGNGSGSGQCNDPTITQGPAHLNETGSHFVDHNSSLMSRHYKMEQPPRVDLVQQQFPNIASQPDTTSASLGNSSEINRHFGEPWNKNRDTLTPVTVKSKHTRTYSGLVADSRRRIATGELRRPTDSPTRTSAGIPIDRSTQANISNHYGAKESEESILVFDNHVEKLIPVGQLAHYGALNYPSHGVSQTNLNNPPVGPFAQGYPGSQQGLGYNPGFLAPMQSERGFQTQDGHQTIYSRPESECSQPPPIYGGPVLSNAPGREGWHVGGVTLDASTHPDAVIRFAQIPNPPRPGTRGFTLDDVAGGPMTRFHRPLPIGSNSSNLPHPQPMPSPTLSESSSGSAISLGKHIGVPDLPEVLEPQQRLQPSRWQRPDDFVSKPIHDTNGEPINLAAKHKDIWAMCTGKTNSPIKGLLGVSREQTVPMRSLWQIFAAWKCAEEHGVRELWMVDRQSIFEFDMERGEECVRKVAGWEVLPVDQKKMKNTDVKKGKGKGKANASSASDVNGNDEGEDEVRYGWLTPKGMKYDIAGKKMIDMVEVLDKEWEVMIRDKKNGKPSKNRAAAVSGSVEGSASAPDAPAEGSATGARVRSEKGKEKEVSGEGDEMICD